ncbi:MAG TPA: HepT-like ribonuclease domain-containing protein [Thermoguttaceae bacterium]
MYDRSVVLEILRSILSATERIQKKMMLIGAPEDFYASEDKRDILDVLCMQLTAIGEGLKQVDKLTKGRLFGDYPQVDWKGLKGIRDVISHQYFDISTGAVFESCKKDIPLLMEAIKTIINSLK